MTRAREIAEAVEEIAPGALAEDWDNPGLQVGDPGGEVNRVLVALTPLPEVFEEAEETGANFLLFHHPLIFRSLNSVDLGFYPGDIIARAVKGGLAVYAAHTNYDAAPEGVSVALAKTLGLGGPLRVVVLRGESEYPEDCGYGRVGRMAESLAPEELRDHVSESLGFPARLVANPIPARRVERVAVLGGSGGSFVREAAASGADAYVTGDLDYHDALLAETLGLVAIDAGHAATELTSLEPLAQRLAELVDVPVSVSRVRR